MSDGSDVDMEETKPVATLETSEKANGAASADDTEKKKALLVYKSNQQSASDDDDDDEEEEEEEDNDGEEDDEDLDAADDDDEEEEDVAHSGEDDDLDDAASMKSDAVGGDVEMGAEGEEDEDDVDEEDDEEGVQVEKDDDESINAPSDDDLDSTATPSRIDTDEEISEKNATGTPHSEKKRFKGDDGGDGHDSDSASSSRALSPIKTESEGKMLTLKSGTTSDVKAIIAARRRTGARKECEVCQEPRNGRRAMLCANCKCMYHSSCYRQRYSKLINASGKQWFCPDCENSKAQVAEREASTPRKKREDAGKPRGARGAKGAPVVKGKEGEVQMATGPSVSEVELKRITDVALRGGKKINGIVLERTEEMLQLTQSLTSEIDNVIGASSWRDEKGNDATGKKESQPPPFTLPIASASNASSQQPLSPVSHSSTNEFKIHADHVNGVDSTEKDVLLTRVHAGLVSLKTLLQQLQVTGIQFEVDLIKEIKLPPPKEEQKPTATSLSTRKAPSAAARASAAGKSKNGASRLYSSKQIQKLEEWYQKSSRPESCEIQAMYRIINSPDYADKELQPDGISVKQIRIWFDNRRAKERLDYMRLKMKDISTTDMDADSVKRMKAAYIDEAKEVLEARVSRLRENGKGPGEIVDEAGDLLLTGEDRPLPTKSTKSSPAPKSQTNSSSAAKEASESGKLSAINQKKRIRIDYVASVRKTVKDARDAGKNEEEIKVLRTAAIERARERLHVPYKNSRQGPSKPLGKEEVTHIKLKMLKLLEEDAPAEEITDVIELLLSVMIPRDILIESALHRQLNLALKAHKDNKELVKQTNKLLDEFNTIIEKGDPVVESDPVKEEGAAKKKKKKDTSLLLDVDAESLPGTPGASPDSPAASPDSRRPRVKFSLEQLVKLEKYFHKDDTPSKKKLDKLAEKLNEIGAQDPSSDEAQKSIDYKQIRCWFYKRRSTNQRPQALTTIDLQDGAGPSSSSSSETESDSNDEGSVSSKGSKSKSAAKRKAPSADSKAPAAKRSKKETPAGEANVRSSSAKKESSSKVKDASGKHTGRIFNVKQLATIIEEYEKNPRPSVARLEELQNILNQDDHADDNFVNPTGVTKRQIKTWFSNRRAKERLDLIKMKVQDKQGGKKSSNGDADADDTADSETEDEDREESKKATKQKSGDSSESADARKELFVSPQRQDGADLDSEDDELSEAESEGSVNANVANVNPSVRMLVDDDDDDSEDDDDDDDDDDVDDSDEEEA